MSNNKKTNNLGVALIGISASLAILGGVTKIFNENTSNEPNNNRLELVGHNFFHQNNEAKRDNYYYASKSGEYVVCQEKNTEVSCISSKDNFSVEKEFKAIFKNLSGNDYKDQSTYFINGITEQSQAIQCSANQEYNNSYFKSFPEWGCKSKTSGDDNLSAMQSAINHFETKKKAGFKR